MKTDLEVAVTRVLDGANRKFDLAIAELAPQAPPRQLTDAERWSELARISRELVSALLEGARRAAILYPILVLGSEEQQRTARRLMSGGGS